MPVKSSKSVSKKPPVRNPPARKPSTGSRVSSGTKPSASKPQKPQSNKPSTSSSTDSVKISSEAQQSKGTNGDDKLNPSGNMPNLIETYGGDDQVWANGGGKTDIKTGEGDDLVGLRSDRFSTNDNYDAKIDGGEGRDAIFVGDGLTGGGRPFHVTNEKGDTVAKNGEGGDKVQIKNVESIHVSNDVSGSNGDDQIRSDFQTGGDPSVRVNENHTIFGHEGNDQIAVKSGDNGSSEVKVWPGEGNNQFRFDGGAASDDVSYISQRNKDGSQPGSDQVSLNGGEGYDRLSISSQNYSLTDKEGKVLSKMGDGADKISADGFEDIWINGEKYGAKE
ncbi:MAG TPA: hypothetical protein EYO33_26035 [Phycisphaerales bacterium]|nr:hypothetical protein [Phycisphaerales bacterium]